MVSRGKGWAFSRSLLCPYSKEDIVLHVIIWPQKSHQVVKP